MRLLRSTTTSQRRRRSFQIVIPVVVVISFYSYYNNNSNNSNFHPITSSVAFVIPPVVVMAIHPRQQHNSVLPTVVASVVTVSPTVTTPPPPSQRRRPHRMFVKIRDITEIDIESSLLSTQSDVNTDVSSNHDTTAQQRQLQWSTSDSDTLLSIHNLHRSAVILIPSLALLLSILLAFMTMTHVDAAFAATATSTTTTTLPFATATAATLPMDWNAIFQKAVKKAVGGGQAGALAAVVQVCTLMWLRTCMNYQYRYGGNLITSFQTLYQEGGIFRLYQGLPFAIVQGPLTRFGDTAANVGVLSLLESIPATQSLPLPVKTLCGSIAAGLWRIVLMPIDTSKTSLQVEGSQGLQKLYSATMEYGPGVLYRGSLAQAAATAVGHFPWFLTYNFFNDILPIVDATTFQGQDPNTLVLLSLGRSALLGLLASCVSDCSSNSLRVIKTTKQTAQLNDSISVNTTVTTSDTTKQSKTNELSYLEVVQLIIEQDGIIGLFGRGLQTRLLTNAIQGAMFSVLWKYFQQQ